MNNLILNNIYEDILELSDINKQNEYWLGKNRNYISSYTEVMCRLFDDNDFNNFVNNIAERELLSKSLITEMKLLIVLLKNYKEKDTDAEIINDPEWQKIINQAKIVIVTWDSNYELKQIIRKT